MSPAMYGHVGIATGLKYNQLVSEKCWKYSKRPMKLQTKLVRGLLADYWGILQL